MCGVWSAEGKCNDSSSSWMATNCSRSCGFCVPTFSASTIISSTRAVTKPIPFRGLPPTTSRVGHLANTTAAISSFGKVMASSATSSATSITTIQSLIATSIPSSTILLDDSGEVWTPTSSGPEADQNVSSSLSGMQSLTSSKPLTLWNSSGDILPTIPSTGIENSFRSSTGIPLNIADETTVNVVMSSSNIASTGSNVSMRQLPVSTTKKESLVTNNPNGPISKTTSVLPTSENVAAQSIDHVSTNTTIITSRSVTASRLPELTGIYPSTSHRGSVLNITSAISSGSTMTNKQPSASFNSSTVHPAAVTSYNAFTIVSGSFTPKTLTLFTSMGLSTAHAASATSLHTSTITTEGITTVKSPVTSIQQSVAITISSAQTNGYSAQTSGTSTQTNRVSNQVTGSSTLTTRYSTQIAQSSTETTGSPTHTTGFSTQTLEFSTQTSETSTQNTGSSTEIMQSTTSPTQTPASNIISNTNEGISKLRNLS